MHITRRPRHSGVKAFVLATCLLTFPDSGPAQTQNPFLGSVPAGTPNGETLPLSLQEAFGRALKYNLGGIESNEDTRAAHAIRLHSLNALLPDLSARVSGAREQINLRALGFNPSNSALPI